MGLPFARTTCACSECVQCCKGQPGPLAPGDFERIAAHLSLALQDAADLFWASPGAVVRDSQTGRTFTIGSITPRRIDGRCVFLDADDRCAVHAVAPAGCALFDTHMSAAEAMPRSLALVRAQAADTTYQLLRLTLSTATSYQPRRYA